MCSYTCVITPSSVLAVSTFVFFFGLITGYIVKRLLTEKLGVIGSPKCENVFRDDDLAYHCTKKKGHKGLHICFVEWE